MSLVEYLERLPNYSLDRQIDRVNNDLGYIPGNLQWATRAQNCRNRQNTLKLNGRPLAELAEEIGLDYDQTFQLFKRGWTEEQIRGYTPNQGRLKEFSSRFSIKVEWRNDTFFFDDFVKRFTKLSYVQANRLRRKGWTPEQLHEHIPRGYKGSI